MKIVKLYERSYSKNIKKSHIVRAMMKLARQQKGGPSHGGK